MNESAETVAPQTEVVKLILTESESKRFWSKVNKDGPVHPYSPELGKCWLWTSCINPGGYGQFWFIGATILIHQLSYRIKFGKPPAEKPHVCHSCDIRNCANPDHLWAGTNTENVHDKIKKGRAGCLSGDENPARKHPEKMTRGEDRWNAKLDESKVRKIRTLCAKGHSRHSLAKKFQVDRALITRIVNLKSWKHVK